MKLIKAFAIGAVLAAGAAFAQEDPTDPNAIARSDLMKTVGMNTGILGNMASGKEPFDAAKAEGAKAALIDASAKIEATFMEQGAADPASEAKPEIWTNWEDFLVKAKALGDAASAVDVASAETIGAGMGAIGGTCKDCHTTYRVMK
ncbi:cytochrome c [Tabrizicola piscis]|uniref:Cytochrome c n=1 Tax=Tabrizicola piscis TaxID=2494374 RepID=A0A3S8U2M4_9RHOB|nr:cytochrome c [Tabrizicola piscis]AZL57861.1 cytochrome c [Tabrizicola piscis]